MTAAKGNQYGLRPGKTAPSTKRHLIPVTEEEHARNHELAGALGLKLADLVRELLDEKWKQHQAQKRASKRPRKG